jgi:uncharacterized protein YjiS (DUF1127 family)
MGFFPATRIEFAMWPRARDLDPVRLIGQLWRAWIRRLMIRHLRRELSAMPDWLLYDAGIDRSDICSLAVEIVDGSREPRRATGRRR